MQQLVQKQEVSQIPESEILNKEERIFKAWGSVEIKDKEGDILPMSEFKKIMPIIMKRGGNIMDRHSNRQVGQILNYEFKDKETAEGPVEGVYLTCQIYKDYEIDDAVWEMIKLDLIKGLSFGGHNKFEEIKFEEGMDVTKILTGMSGFEFSVVPSMANQEASMDQVNFLAKSNMKKEDGETSQDSDHYHLYRMDEDGNGETLGTLPREQEDHKHQIVNGVVQSELGHSHRLVRKLVDKEQIQKPFAGFADFDACVSASQDKDDPAAFCAFLKDRVEKIEKEYDETKKTAETPRGNTLLEGSKNVETFIKNNALTKSMADKKVKKIDEEQMPEAPQENSVDERLANCERMLAEIMERLPVSKVEHEDEEEDKDKADHKDEEEDEEEDVNKEGDGEKVILPKVDSEVVQDQKPAEGAENDEVKMVEKTDVKAEVKKQVDAQMGEIKKTLGLTKESTPRMGVEPNMVNKGETRKAPQTFKEINKLGRNTIGRKRL